MTTTTTTTSSSPTVYFIDDSATMREVIKIAFRRENINVVACHDAAAALNEIARMKPDIVITDVIMPDKDGYDVCQFIKSHPELSKTPVVLMSGVVNRAVAERAFAVKADELLRKPFQPQDLIARVKHLLKPNVTPAPSLEAAASAAAALSSIFAGTAPRPASPVATRPSATNGGASSTSTLAQASSTSVTPPNPTPSNAQQRPAPSGAAPTAVSPITAGSPGDAGVASAGVVTRSPDHPITRSPAPVNGSDSNKLRIEIMRLENLVKKLQSELQAEREYSRSLETHVKSLQEAGN